MKKVLCSLLFAASAPWSAHAADAVIVTVAHDLATARPGEVIVVPFAEVRRRLPGVLLDHVVVKDAVTGAMVPAQVTNFDPDDRRALYNDLVFQHDFAAGERSARFTVEKTTSPVLPFPTRVFARYVPERLDDFAWENDRVAHRMYGPGLDTPAAGGSRMVSSGIDVWAKKVRYPIVDRWYLKGHDAYHVDTGEGLDFYDVGGFRGAGGTGVWDGRSLYVSHNWQSWRVLANGPLRAVFELTYAPWATGDGVSVAEVKRFTVDAGRQLDQVESTFTFSGPAELTVAVGLTRHAKKAPQATTSGTVEQGWLGLWEEFSVEKGLGVGVVAASAPLVAIAEKGDERLALFKVKSGEPLRYHIGAGWAGSGDFKDGAEWAASLADFAARLRSAVRVSFDPN